MDFMKTILLLITLSISYYGASAQHNLLGVDFNHIFGKYDEDPEFFIKIDTVNSKTIVMTCKTSAAYPYYTYEIDVENNECVSFGTVSKDRQVFDAYVDMLSTMGKLVDIDSAKNNFTYSVNTKNNETFFYSIKQPYINSDYISRRCIFYVLVTKDKK